jgi:hypothetical protein
MDSVYILHEYGADFSFRDRWGQTPIDEARANGNHGIVAVVEARSRDISRTSIRVKPSPSVIAVAADYARSLSRQLFERRKMEATSPAAVVLPIVQEESQPHRVETPRPRQRRAVVTFAINDDEKDIRRTSATIYAMSDDIPRCPTTFRQILDDDDNDDDDPLR